MASVAWRRHPVTGFIVRCDPSERTREDLIAAREIAALDGQYYFAQNPQKYWGCLVLRSRTTGEMVDFDGARVEGGYMVGGEFWADSEFARMFEVLRSRAESGANRAAEMMKLRAEQYRDEKDAEDRRREASRLRGFEGIPFKLDDWINRGDDMHDARRWYLILLLTGVLAFFAGPILIASSIAIIERFTGSFLDDHDAIQLAQLVSVGATCAWCSSHCATISNIRPMGIFALPSLLRLTTPRRRHDARSRSS